MAAVHDPYYERIDLSFSNTKECFRVKSTYDLARSIMVFKVMPYTGIVVVVINIVVVVDVVVLVERL